MRGIPPDPSSISSLSPSKGLDRDLFEALPLPLWVCEPVSLRILDVNEVACRKYGYSRDEFLNLTIRELGTYEGVGLVGKADAAGRAEGFEAGTWRHRLKDGTVIHVEIASREMYFNGMQARLICPIDVTQRVRVETTLREREGDSPVLKAWPGWRT